MELDRSQVYVPFCISLKFFTGISDTIRGEVLSSKEIQCRVFLGTQHLQE